MFFLKPLRVKEDGGNERPHFTPEEISTNFAYKVGKPGFHSLVSRTEANREL